MAFVNEYISKEDFERYKLSEIDSNFHPSVKATHWTVDRQQDMYLRRLSRGREENSHESWWSLYWRGELLSLQLDVLEAGGEPGKPAWTKWSLRRIAIFGGRELPSGIKERLPELLEDLKDALTTYKDLGVLSMSTEFTAYLEVDLVY